MSDTPEVVATPEAVSASLSAGFNKVRGETPTEAPPEKTDEPAIETPPPEAKAEDTTTTEAKAEEVKEEPIAGLGLTATEVRTQLAAAADSRTQLEASERKLLGKMGSLKSELLEIVNKQAKTEAPATTATLKATFKNLREAGYEDVADNIEKDLASIQSAPAGTVDAEEINKRITDGVNAELAKERVKLEVRFLTKAHPDWQAVRDSDDFKVWRASQPAAIQTELARSTDSDFLIGQITAHKEWKKANDPTAIKQKNAARLEGNVSPQGTPGSTPTAIPDNKGLANGFNKVRKLG